MVGKNLGVFCVKGSDLTIVQCWFYVPARQSVKMPDAAPWLLGGTTRPDNTFCIDSRIPVCLVEFHEFDC
jgi:hypothetical protein